MRREKERKAGLGSLALQNLRYISRFSIANFFKRFQILTHIANDKQNEQ